MNKNRIEHVLKHNVFIQTIYRFVLSLFFRFIGLFVRTDPKLVLMNGHGYLFNHSPRAIYLKALEHGLDEEYTFVWAVKATDINIPGNCKIVRMDSWRYFITALKAKYWVSCVNIERGLSFKKKKTIYLNTWHGALINLCGNAVNGRKDFHCKDIDYFCINSDLEGVFFKRDFNLRDGVVVKTGYPRNDFLYTATSELKQKIKDELGIPLEKKIIVYAPTWRDSDDHGTSYKICPPIDWDLWKRTLGDEYVVLLRTHPYTTKLMNVHFDEFVRDYSTYPEVNRLLIVADILISDYSSISLDYSILEKPLLCFGYDYYEYKASRGFYYDLEEKMPFGVIKNQKVLLDIIQNLNFDEACLKTKNYKKEFMKYGGNASEKCLDLLFHGGAKC